MHNRIQDFKASIAQGKVEKVINEMLTLLKNTEHEQVILLISQDFRGITSKALSGLITDEDERTQKTKITNRVLNLLDELSPNTLQSVSNTAADASSTTSFSDVFNLKKHWWKYITGIGMLMGIFGGCSEALTFLGCNKSGSNLSNLTVYVQDKNGNLIPELHKQGYVLLSVSGGEYKEELIDDKGTASFKNVKKDDKVRIKIKFSAPYALEKPNSTFIVPDDNRIYLSVGLQHLGLIYGHVISGDQPLGNVLVAIGNLRDTSKVETGYFEIPIPENAQRQEQEVQFIKKGYKMLVKKALPQTNQPLNVVMEKEK